MAEVSCPLHVRRAEQGSQEHAGSGSEMVRSIFAQPTEEEIWEQYKRVVDHLEDLFPAAANVLCEAGEEILAFSVFPKSI